MTGGLGLDRDDSSSNRRWRRANKGRWKRAFAGAIKDGEVQLIRVSPGLIRRPESTRTRTLCHAWVARVSPGLKGVQQAGAPDSSRLSRRRTVSTGMALPWVARLGIRAGPCNVLPAVRAMSSRRVATHSLAPESSIIDDGLASGRLSQSGPCLGWP